MIRKNSFTSFLPAALLASAVSVGPAFAQEVFKSEASVQFFGTFVSTTTYQGVQQTATDSGGVLANYRYFFNDYTGVEVNYGFATGTQKYLYFPTGVSNSVRANSDEATAALVLRYPKHRVVPFGLLGTGALIFVPQSAPPTTQARAAFVYGGGIDVGFAHRLFLRAEYRGFVYSSPDFNTFYLGLDRVTHRAEPSIGFGIRL
jgi:opacity protein-like surface antigen